jgi:hypothetical protein
LDEVGAVLVKRFKVGVTAAYNGDNLADALWSNGIGQNIGYMLMLLQRLPIVESVCVVSCPGPQAHPLARAFGVPSMPLLEAIERLDLIIELGARAINPEMLDRLHAHGGRLVSYVAGNVMVMNFEQLACDVAHGDNVFRRYFDACWVTPQHWHTCRAYLTMTRSEVTRIAPHVWDAHCIRAFSFGSQKNPYYRKPADNKWRLGCFDPSVNVVKTFHYPVLVADRAYRTDPSLISGMMLFSAEKIKADEHVQQFINAMDLGRKGLITAEGRHAIINVMGPHIQAVVTHQWQNNLNYLYWDVLYLGWPLIHNSTEFEDVGYYYPEFDAGAGGEVLVHALRTHDETFAENRRKVFDLLWRFSVDNPEVQATYTDLIEEVMST